MKSVIIQPRHLSRLLFYDPMLCVSSPLNAPPNCAKDPITYAHASCVPYPPLPRLRPPPFPGMYQSNTQTIIHIPRPTKLPSQLPNNPPRSLRHLAQRRRHRLHHRRRGSPSVLRVAVHVEPRAADDELQVMREVEDRRDEGEGEDEEEDRVCKNKHTAVSRDLGGGGGVEGGGTYKR